MKDLDQLIEALGADTVSVYQCDDYINGAEQSYTEYPNVYGITTSPDVAQVSINGEEYEITETYGFTDRELTQYTTLWFDVYGDKGGQQLTDIQVIELLTQ